MRMFWKLISLLWIKILSLERHEAMNCVLRDKVSQDHIQEKTYGDAIRKYIRVNDTLNIADCHCVTKTKVTRIKTMHLKSHFLFNQPILSCCFINMFSNFRQYFR